LLVYAGKSDEENIKFMELVGECSISVTGKILVIQETSEFKTFIGPV
jgi:hypothetical protein